MLLSLGSAHGELKPQAGEWSALCMQPAVGSQVDTNSLWGQTHPNASAQDGACLHTLGDKRWALGSTQSWLEEVGMQTLTSSCWEIHTEPVHFPMENVGKAFLCPITHADLVIRSQAFPWLTALGMAGFVMPVSPNSFPHTLLRPSQNQMHHRYVAKPCFTPAKMALASRLSKLCRVRFITSSWDCHAAAKTPITKFVNVCNQALSRSIFPAYAAVLDVVVKHRILDKKQKIFTGFSNAVIHLFQISSIIVIFL